LGILVVGDAVVDRAYRVPRLPRPGETLLAEARTVGAGGKGLNQAVAARRAGAAVRLVAAVGRDQAARRLRAVLAREGLDPALLVAVDAPTDEAVVWVAADGQNAIVGTAEAARRLRPADVAAALDQLGPADTLLAHGNLPPETTALCVEVARGRGARLVVNTAPVLPGAGLLAAAADVLVVNAGEAAGLAGVAGPEEAAAALVGRGAGAVVVTLGAAGAHLLAGDGAHHRLPAPAVAAVDATGAGDVLVGVLAAALDAGIDLRAATAWAVRAASLKVTRHGTITGFPTTTQVAALRHG
jgi:ribokinase